MDVFISADIEGVTGLVSWSQCGRPDGKHFDFGFARRMMSHDVNAAIRGARAAGAERIVVKDSHGNSKNLLIEDLEPGVELISGHGSGTDGMMQGIDGSFGAAMLVGYHAMAGTTAGVMEHTISGGVYRMWLNDHPIGEMGLAAGVAGRYGVPVVCVTSDTAGCAEAQSLVPGVSTAEVKEGFGRYMGRLRHPSETGPLVEAAAKAGVAKAGQIAPWIVEGAATAKIAFNRAEMADTVAKLVGAARLDAYTVEYRAEDFQTAHRAIWTMLALSFIGRDSGD